MEITSRMAGECFWRDGFATGEVAFFRGEKQRFSANSSKKKLNIIGTFFHVLACFLRRSWSYRDSIRVQ
jgi:hypothetical protein